MHIGNEINKNIYCNEINKNIYCNEINKNIYCNEINKNIYCNGKAVKDEPNGTMTEADLTEKSITPIGNFSHYVKVTQDWIMLKGGLLSCRKCLITFHIPTGDILRANVKEGTKLGKKTSEYTTASKLILIALIVNLVKDRLAQLGIAERGCHLDGFPRAPDQAKAIVDAGIAVNKFVLIEVPDDTLVERGCGRRLDPETGDIYHRKSKPELAEYAKLGLPIRGAERVVFTLELKCYEKAYFEHKVGSGAFGSLSAAAGKAKLGQKKANVKKIQINGGLVEQKVNFTTNFFEQEAKVSNIFAQHKTINVIGATKAKGLTGVGAHWGYTSLSRLAHRGLRTVACIGAWRPARVQFHLPRSGPNGFHLHTEINGTIRFVSKAVKDEPYGIMAKADLTEKNSFLLKWRRRQLSHAIFFIIKIRRSKDRPVALTLSTRGCKSHLAF